jgi:hypothetical protein
MTTGGTPSRNCRAACKVLVLRRCSAPLRSLLLLAHLGLPYTSRSNRQYCGLSKPFIQIQVFDFFDPMLGSHKPPSLARIRP